MSDSTNLRSRLKRFAVAAFLGLAWTAIADEHYATLIRAEHQCISSLMDRTGAEHPPELNSLARYQYRNCQIHYREWGMLERILVLPSSLYR